MVSSGLNDSSDLEGRKRRAFAWFMELRDRIAAAFGDIEDDLPVSMPHAGRPPGRFIKRLSGNARITQAPRAVAASWR